MPGPLHADPALRGRLAGFHAVVRREISGCAPPKVEEIITVTRAAGDGAHGPRPRGLIVILWCAVG